MYPHPEINVPANVPSTQSGFHGTLLDVERRKPQHLLGFCVLSWISLELLDQSCGGGRGIRTPVTFAGKAVFKTACFNRSHIPPRLYKLYPVAPPWRWLDPPLSTCPSDLGTCLRFPHRRDPGKQNPSLLRLSDFRCWFALHHRAPLRRLQPTSSPALPVR